MQPSIRPRRPWLAEVLAIAGACKVEECVAVLAMPTIYFYEGGIARRGADGKPVHLLDIALSKEETWARLITAGRVQPASYRTFACMTCDGSGSSMFEAEDGARGYETCTTCTGKLVFPTPQWMLQALALAADFPRVQAFEEDMRGRSDCEVAWKLLRQQTQTRAADEAAKGPTYRREQRIGQRQWATSPTL